MNAAAPGSQSRWRRWPRRLAAGLAALLLLALLARVVFFQGPYLPPEPLPEAKFLDMHCHIAGLGVGDSGCFVSPALRDSWKFDFYLRAFGVTRAEVEAEGDEVLPRRMSEQIAASRHIRAAIILAMDGVVDDQGALDHARTEVYVPNEYVAMLAARHTNLLFGASINPYRPDALERLDEVKRQGARLLKWIPSIMAIDPADPRIEPFYRKLVELDLPLLTHAGQERSFTHAHDELCDPERLRLPLRLGVRVVVAHAASTGRNEGERDTDRLRRLMTDFPNLHTDISSLTQANKLGYLREVLRAPEFADRLLYGTDFPLINMPMVSPWWFPLNLRFGQMREIAALRNPWDRDVALKQALGVPREVFERAEPFFTDSPSSPAPVGLHRDAHAGAAASLPPRESSHRIVDEHR